MSIHTCGDFPSDPFCTCYSQTKEQTHEYRQFNKTNQTYSCCDIIPLNNKITESSIRESLQIKIQDFKIPRIIRFVKTFPKTRTGKIKRI